MTSSVLRKNTGLEYYYSEMSHKTWGSLAWWTQYILWNIHVNCSPFYISSDGSNFLCAFLTASHVMMYNCTWWGKVQFVFGKSFTSFYYYVQKFCDKDIFEYVPRTHSYRMGISWAFSSRKPFLHEQRVLCSYCWQMACSFRFEHCWLYVQDSKRFLAAKRKKWRGLVTLLKRRPSRPDVFHFEQTSNCLDNLVTFSAFFFYYIFQMIYHHLKLFSVKGQRVCTYFLKKKTWPFLVFFWKLTLASILLLWCGHITSVYLSAFYMTFMRDDGEPLFWDLGFII